ncbi:MAG: MFS transporter [Dehalococcoidales bacterium]|nr:MFS transporter [Dehalococcoidales bacterium]
MVPETVTGRTGRIFYGWFALAGVALVIFVVGGVFVNSFGVLLPVITVEFGWSRAMVAGALSAGILAFGLPSPLYGIIVAKLRPRITLITGNLLAGLGIAGVYFVQEIWQMYILYILIGIGGGFGGYISCTTVISNWFIKKRSLALGVFIACAGMGGFVFPPLTTSLISAIGWRETWLVLAGVIVLFGVLLGATILTRNRPEDMGLTPDGMPADAYTELEAAESQAVSDDKAAGWGIRQIMKGPTAWLIGGFSAANTFTMGTMVSHQIAYLQDIKFSAMTAATTMSFMSVFSILGSLVFGALAMRFKVRYLASAFFAIQLMGLVVLLSSKELGLIYVYAAFQGMSNGALTAAMPTFIGAYYPRQRYAQVMGMVLPFQVCSNAIATTVAGAIFDATSTYTPAFITAAIFCLAGLIFVFMARRPKQIAVIR